MLNFEKFFVKITVKSILKLLCKQKKNNEIHFIKLEAHDLYTTHIFKTIEG